MRFINPTRKIARWTCSSVKGAMNLIVEPEFKTRFSTVDDAAFEKLLYESDAKNTRRGTESTLRTFRSYLREKVHHLKSSTVEKRVLNSGSTDEAASFIFVY
jgi:hypothetical protein